MNPIDLTTMSYPDLKALAHDIQLKVSNDQQKTNAALRKVLAELDLRVKVMPQADKDIEASTLQNIITDLQRP